ncbi:MAG: ATP phosphoribosyltransferase [Bacteroidetes bacterium QS_8_68_28]|nr:MAG: ATP phosphoribosyltransferase [Bacteroidetes bacterium QS_8_68_28]
MATDAPPQPDTATAAEDEAAQPLRLGLPKGSLQDSTFELLHRAGYDFSVSSRSYFPSIDDEALEAMLVRAQEMARYVEDGTFDAGITGKDWIMETGSDEVIEVADLVYSKRSMRPVRWVLAVPERSSIDSVKDLDGKKVATEVTNLTRKWLAEHDVEAQVEFSWGATEAKCPELVDAIVEVTETGSTLRANGLRIAEVLMKSNTKLIANREAWNDDGKRRRIENLAMLIEGAIRSESRKGLKLNARRDDARDIIDLLPALRMPTVSSLALGDDWVAIETVIEEKDVRGLLPKLKRAGAEGIIEYELNKIIP